MPKVIKLTTPHGGAYHANVDTVALWVRFAGDNTTNVWFGSYHSAPLRVTQTPEEIDRLMEANDAQSETVVEAGNGTLPIGYVDTRAD